MKTPPFTLLPCRLPGIEAVRADTSRAFGRHVHDQFGIGLIDRGAQKSASGRGLVEAMAGDLITVNPGEVHDGTPIGDGGRSWRMLYLDPDVVVDLVADMTGDASTRSLAGPGVGTAEFTQPTLHDPRRARAYRALFAALTASAPCRDSLLAEQALLSLLAGLLRSEAEEPRAIPAGIASARTMIDDDPAAALRLHDLAQEARLSRYQFLRGFTRATGLTPHAYLVQRRLHRARRLIGQGLPLAEVAVSSGFCDQSHLTRHFVRSFGLSPALYAKAAR
ncbi:AraC family transcriptional regulator [Roseateles aquatilis]|uniref:AraC family transcriptional regulator n=1 Tax=Roseateles aquatilis TaxID=431061 RepID=A0A246JKY8_9BURK|nr:AraC family transcriptional regulator [Roseateles aquatilis]OWQ93210.1 AraC family transcriptional regulator [Roseateles aquatilis]